MKKKGLLTVVAVVMALIMVGSFALATNDVGEVSNTLTLSGSVGQEQMVLEWEQVVDENGDVTPDPGDGPASVQWQVGETYRVDIRATNPTGGTYSGVKGMISGIDGGDFLVEHYLQEEGHDYNNQWIPLNTDLPFGPEDGDTYAPGDSKVFIFRVTPLAVGNFEQVSVVLVDDTGWQ